MNSKSIFIIVLLVIVALFTNPNKAKHKESIIENLQNKAAKDFGVLGKLSNNSGLTQLLIPDSDIIYEDFYLFSLTKNTDDQLKTIGVFTKVILTLKD